MHDASAAAQGAAAVAALLLLPGLLVVRAPWTAVPFLSLFFWIASWWWLPSTGRAGAVGAALVAFLLAGVLRLVRFDGRWPSWPALVAVSAALLHAAAALGSGPSFDPVPSQLMAWHDGLPATYVPLREAGSFGAHPHGWDAFAADLGRLSGLAMPRSAALAAAVAGALSSLGVYALVVRFFAPGLAAGAAVGVSTAAAVMETLGRGLDPAVALALGFALSAAGLVAGARSRSAAVGAGAFVATALMTSPAVVAAVAVIGAAAGGLAWRRVPAVERDALLRRLGLAGTAAAVAAAPFLLRVAAASLGH